MPCFVIFSPVSAVQKLLKSVKISQICSQMYTATFYEPRRKCTFWFFQVRCAHKSGDVINFIIVACRIYSRLKWYKNCENRLRLAKVIVKNKMSRFLWFSVYIFFVRRRVSHLVNMWRGRDAARQWSVTSDSCYWCRIHSCVTRAVVSDVSR